MGQETVAPQERLQYQVLYLGKVNLSIIIPTKNAGKTITDALKSIVTQCTNHAYEVIVIDSLSEDDTVSIAMKYGATIVKKESTIYEAQNIGITMATGEFLYFLGADDVLVPNGINSILTMKNDLTQGLVYHSYIRPVFSEFQQSFVYARNLFDKYGLFDSSHPVYADLEFKQRLANNGIVQQKVVKEFAIVAPFGFSSVWRK